MNIISLPREKIILGVTTSVLFDMSEPDAVFREAGPLAYDAYMREHEGVLLTVNPYFEVIKKLAQDPDHEIVLLSRNSPSTAIRAIQTLMYHGVVLSSFSFTNGSDPVRYLEPYKVDQFITSNQRDAEIAVARGFAAGHIPNPCDVSIRNIGFKHKRPEKIPTDLTTRSNVHVLGNLVSRHDYLAQHVFDIDGVYADLTSDRYYQENGLELYREFEKAGIGSPMKKGPFFSWFEKVSKNKSKLLTSICTLRGTMPAYRLLLDLYQRDLSINGELHAISGRDKYPFLKSLKDSYGLLTLFYDDNKKYIEQANRAGLVAAHVVHPQDPRPAA